MMMPILDPLRFLRALRVQSCFLRVLRVSVVKQQLVSGLVMIPEPGQVELLDRAFVAGGSVADGASAHEMAHFFSDVLSVVACALQRLRHEQDVDAIWPGATGLIFEVPEKDQIANAVDLAIGAQNRDGAA